MEVLVAAYTDAVHIGGLIDVLEANDITDGYVVFSGCEGITANWNNFIVAAAKDRLTLRQ